MPLDRFSHRIRSAEGKYAATMDSVDEGAKGIKLDEATLEDGKVRLIYKAAKATFEGNLNEAGTAIVGEWKQGPNKLPLTLKRVAQATVVKRPQLPKDVPVVCDIRRLRT